ncbi:MAG TPA: outer membrane beta-barrel protein [Bacteroidales bacterium]|nr:outer membrane beta-barrel protein [Bacteroidales bacterium]
MKHRQICLCAVLSLLVTLSSSGALSGQRRLPVRQNLPHYDYRPYHFGFALGVNKMNFAIRPVGSDSLRILNALPGNQHGALGSILPRPEYGFHIGIVSNLRLAPMFDLRFVPTLAFGERFLEYRFLQGNNQSLISQPFEVTYIELPLHLKYKSMRMSNVRAYVLGGFKFSIDLSSNQFKDEAEPELIFARTLRDDLHYELGAGFDFYFYYFKFSVEVKASFGMRDLSLPGEQGRIFYEPIDRLNSKNIMVSFLFE